MFLVDHIVHLQLWRPSLPDILCVLGGLAQNIIGTGIVSQVVVLLAFVVTIAARPERGGHIQSTRTIVHVEIVVQRVTIFIDATCVVLKAKALTLRLFQRDTNHGLRRGGITGAWVLNHVDMLNLIGAQARELLHVLHPSAVDIHLGSTTAQHFYTSVALSLQLRNL